MTQRLDIFYSDDCNKEERNTSIRADECRIFVPKYIQLVIDFRLDSQTVNTPNISIVEIDDAKVVFSRTLSGSNTVDQAFVPASNEDKKYLFTIKNMSEDAYRFKCKENSRNVYEMGFDDTHGDKDYNDVIAYLKLVPKPLPLKDKDIVFFRHRKGTFINTDHGTGPSVKMNYEANYDTHISDEGWRIERAEGSGPLMHGDEIFLRTWSKYYLNTHRKETGNGWEQVVEVLSEANFNPDESNELWIIEKALGSGPVNYGDAVFIKSRINYYLTSDGKDKHPVTVLLEPDTTICHSNEIWFVEGDLLLDN
ncbi:hypothetical protein [Bacillus sp. FDAARGOS_235]|uniref:hypothetical protein n=1 Tax=Bacillus sp. FDAARGOS_235 TaxID=1839798 RepID=UPI0011A18039|nr:hypothetical protein [Bacillus sp. FDAARGOS_235]